jgi:hypothetical protein
MNNIKEKIGELVLNVTTGDFKDTKEVFDQIMSAKVLNALDTMRIDVSKNMFGDDTDV